MFRALIWSFLCCIPALGISQADSILQMDKDKQMDAIQGLYNQMLAHDPSRLYARMKEYESKFRKQKQPGPAQLCWSLAIQSRIDLLPFEDTARFTIAFDALEEARRHRWEVAEAYLLFHVGLLYYEHGRNGPAFENFLRSYQLTKQIGFATYPHLTSMLITTSLIHHNFGDYASALDYLREIIALRDRWPNPYNLTNALNTAGLCYRQLEKYDSANLHFVMARDLALRVLQDTGYATLIDGNRAMVLRSQGKTEEAIPLLENDFRISQKYAQTGSAVNAALELTDIYLEKKDIPVARKYLEFATANINRGDLKPLMTYYENTYRLRRIEGDYTTALMYLDSAQALQDTISRVHDAALLTQAKQRVEVEQYLRELSTLEALRKRQILIRNSFLIITFLLGLVGILWYHRRHIQRQHELSIASLNQRLAEEALESARMELGAFTRMMTDKNALIESINEELSQAKANEEKLPVVSHLSNLMSRTILTEDEWQQFRVLFEKVYPGYLFRMKEKFPDITPADIRLLCLTRLHMAPKEMAAMLGISYDGIKKSRRRLRQRLNLPEEGTLEEVAESI